MLDQLLPTNSSFLCPDFGSYYFGSGWYDPALGRFIQPDIIVPDPSNLQVLSCYSYVNSSRLQRSGVAPEELGYA